MNGDVAIEQRRATVMLRTLVLASLALAFGGCGSGGTQNNSEATHWTKITWSEIVGLVRRCRVLRVDQAHNRLVSVRTRDHRRLWAYEPRIDAIGPIVNRANARCGPIIFATE